MFLNLSRACALMKRVEVVIPVIFSQLVMNFEARLEKVFKQLKLLGFSVDQTWASLWGAILATWKFCLFCYESLQNCCCLPTAGGPTKNGTLRSSQGCVFTAELRLIGTESFLLLA